MFMQRLISTLILLPLVLAGIYYMNHDMFAAVSLLLALACGFEWMQLIPLKSIPSRLFFFAFLIACSFLIMSVYTYWLSIGMVLWAGIFLVIRTYPGSQNLWGHRWLVGLMALILLPLFAHSLVAIFDLERGRLLLIYLLFLVWAADIGAYFTGKLWGKNKLIPLVSPGKTLEGVAGGMILSMLVAVVAYLYFRPTAVGSWFLLAFMIALVSLMGDLFISMLKRRTGIKDTGNLIPGHGGILDRLDSLIAAAPFFYCGLRYITLGI